ncbi:ABC transporter permease [Flexithrix dorotheae]|uniref:ABC transporter permease n=1 Tax=Flexithrix dorotheae TaxID=70993 RepID=UPI0003692CC2|nr:FtsX-like permease family protein [Flexithrix dorotheae]
MAWRDSRKNRSRLLLFTSSIILGIAALVAINSFSNNLKNDIDDQAKSLIGADLSVRGRLPMSDSVHAFFDTLALFKANEVRFASMAYFPVSDGTRLIQIKGLEGDFPFYGEFETVPQSAARDFRNGRKALVDNTLLIQFGADVGDSVKIGKLNFLIAGRLEKAPGEIGLNATIAPTVYIPGKYLEETGLIKKGSRINYTYYYKFESEERTEEVVEKGKKFLKTESLRYETVEGRKENVGEAFSDLTQFLNLVGFVALLLGCVGVASAVHIYIKEKIGTVAVLRCLGVKGTGAFLIYLFQISAMGLFGSIVGAILGSGIQVILPKVLQDFLPLEVSYSISWIAIAEGIFSGFIVSILFALLPLLTVRKISPLRTLRAFFEEDSSSKDLLKWLAFLAIAIFIFGFAYLQIREIKEAFFFTGFIALCFLILTGIGRLIMWLVKKYFPASWSYVWRQGIANLYRPNNQTLILIVSIGLGTALISTLFFTQSLLLDKVELSASENQPNMVLFDIQTPQKDEVEKLVEEFDMPLIQKVPVVNIGVQEINGVTKFENEQDTTSEIDTWVYNREYRVTYRDTLIDSETLEKGNWVGEIESFNDSIFISIDEGFARRMHVKLGDEILFNVQGTPVKTYVSSFRKIDWNRVQTNFLIVFPKGVLEEAPQFHVVVTRVKSDEQSAKFQQALVKSFPNVSSIDLALILKTLDDVLGKVSFVIRFMALFSIVTGILVLIGSVIISKYQRIQESVLLRTLGANRKQVLKINALEYFFLGSLASLSGIILALVGSWALAYFNFDSPFVPDPVPSLIVLAIITGLTVIIGMLNTRGILGKPPLEILRSEV